MPLSLSLVLKLAAVSLTGMTALLACRNMNRNETLQTQLTEIRDSLRSVSRTPTIRVLGLKGRGKSSFVTTICRVLAGEDGQLVFRTQTAPLGPTRTTREPTTVAASGLLYLVDTPGLPVRCPSRSHLEEALGRIPADSDSDSTDCVVVVLSCTDALRLSEIKLAEMVALIRERGLHSVVVLTHEKKLKNRRQMEALRKEVTKRARTECIYFIENYAAGSSAGDRHLITMKNNFTTHNVTLAIIRQCVEFAVIHQSNLPLKTHTTAVHIS